MIIGVVKEKKYNDNRVALTPQIVEYLIKDKYEILLETGAGEKAGFGDEEYQKVGANLVTNAEDVYQKSQVICKIWGPIKEEFSMLPKNVWIIANFESFQDNDIIQNMQQIGVKCIALERLPRLSRLQDIDILSSQNNISGYKAAIIALNSQTQVAPLMMTSAGTLKPLKALVLGIGVSGLQVIATLKRNGLIVYASDIRDETKEQAKSLGAIFVNNDHKIISEYLSQCKILITTAFSEHGKTPQIVSQNMLKNMPFNSIAVDISGGNIEISDNNTITLSNNVKVIRAKNLASDIAYSASFLFSQNIYNFIKRWPDIQNDEQVWPLINLTS